MSSSGNGLYELLMTLQYKINLKSHLYFSPGHCHMSNRGRNYFVCVSFDWIFFVSFWSLVKPCSMKCKIFKSLSWDKKRPKTGANNSQQDFLELAFSFSSPYNNSSLLCMINLNKDGHFHPASKSHQHIGIRFSLILPGS